jgi:feruloyl esterase
MSRIHAFVPGRAHAHVAPWSACLVILLSAAAPAAGATCESLASLAIPFANISVAQSVPAGTFTPPVGPAIAGLPSFCRVALTIKPTADSNINIEVWMPTASWNNRYEGTGGGGYTGAITYASLATGIQQGFAVANTDMGTIPATVLDGTALVGHPERWLDFGSRSTHEMTVAAKMLIAAYYGQSAGHSYFVGCSTGGHQALEEAQVFPDDYDGILGGAPGHNRTHLHTAFVWDYAVPHKTAGAFIPASKLAVLNSAVLAACVGRDGGLATDTFLTDPRDCSFDPAALLCTAGDAPNCLTAQQLDTARKFYDGPRNSRTGARIYPGWSLGTETGWAFLEDPALLGLPAAPAFEGITTWALGLHYNPLTVDFDQDMATVDAVLAPTVNFMSTDLNRFNQHGGKLLLYHGFADAIVSTQDTINYYTRLMNEQGLTLAQEQTYARLFLVPGMGHCSGGPGPNTFDALMPLVQWVEQGVAPSQIVATKFVNDDSTQGVQMTRPLCAYPQEARYSGSGNPNAASSFACAGDSGDEPTPELPARDYLAPLVIQASAPGTFDTHINAGKFAVVLQVPPGSDDFHQWSPGNVKAEGASAILGAPSLDGRTYSVFFKWSDLQNFFANAPGGPNIDLMLTGTLQHDGHQSLFAASAPVRVVR